MANNHTVHSILYYCVFAVLAVITGLYIGMYSAQLANHSLNYSHFLEIQKIEQSLQHDDIELTMDYVTKAIDQKQQIINQRTQSLQ